MKTVHHTENYIGLLSLSRMQYFSHSKRTRRITALHISFTFIFLEIFIYAYLCDNSRSSTQLCSTEGTPSAKLSKSLSDRSLRVRGRGGNCRPKLNGTLSVCGDSDANRNLQWLLRLAPLPVATTGGINLFLTPQSVTFNSGILCYHSADGRTTAVLITYSRQHRSCVATTRFHHRSQQAFTVHHNEASKDHASRINMLLFIRVFIYR
jgi:hypothetical protein